MSKLLRFRVVFEEEASEFLIAQPAAKRRKLLDIAYAIARNPYGLPDYVLPDIDGRMVSHISTERHVISYWIDDAVKRIVILEIERE